MDVYQQMLMLELEKIDLRSKCRSEQIHLIMKAYTLPMYKQAN